MALIGFRVVLGGILAGMIATLAAPLRAADLHSEQFGRPLYVKYCGSCHGPGGKGDGVVGTFLRPKPADLTQLARKAGGTFPFYETMRTIDGRRTLRAHGDPDMPVWGEIFRAEASAGLGANAEVQGKLVLITEYLGAIQER
jgi:mono/diheme cytochrome c family protein